MGLGGAHSQAGLFETLVCFFFSLLFLFLFFGGEDIARVGAVTKDGRMSEIGIHDVKFTRII